MDVRARGRHMTTLVIWHLLWWQLLLQWYPWQQRVRVRVMIGFLVQGGVRNKIMIRVRVTRLRSTFAFIIGAIVAGANVVHSITHQQSHDLQMITHYQSHDYQWHSHESASDRWHMKSYYHSYVVGHIGRKAFFVRGGGGIIRTY